MSVNRQLQQIYMACIDAVLEGISTYSRTHNIHEVQLVKVLCHHIVDISY